MAARRRQGTWIGERASFGAELDCGGLQGAERSHIGFDAQCGARLDQVHSSALTLDAAQGWMNQKDCRGPLQSVEDGALLRLH